MFNHLEDSTFPMYNWNRQCPSHLILNQSNSTEQGSRICKSRKWRGRRSVNRIQFEPNILNLPSFFSESGNKQNWMKKDHLNMVVCYCDWLRLIKRPKKGREIEVVSYYTLSTFRIQILNWVIITVNYKPSQYLKDLRFNASSNWIIGWS